METRSALISGITGQDGSYLADLLLEKGYDVYGLYFSDDDLGNENIDHIISDIHLVPGDLRDRTSIDGMVSDLRPDEMYNLAAISSVGACERDPVLAVDVNAIGVVRLLDAVRNLSPGTRLFQASSAEIFGDVDVTPQSEATPLRPRNAYGASKVAAHLFVRYFRESHDIHASCGIMYNHESPRRGPGFVTRKITKGVARIHLGLAKDITLGNINSRRDWGNAIDYVRAMWMMLQIDRPDDYVIASGTTRSVRDLLDVAFRHVGIEGWSRYVKVSEEYWRPLEDIELKGDCSKISRELGWVPEISFEEMVGLMVDEDIERLSEG